MTDFSIYQGKNGGIYLMTDNAFTELTQRQVQELYIDIFSLVNFDYIAYQNHYKENEN